MKIAILMQGSPRFCSELDIFLDNLTDDGNQYDWYLYMWTPNPAPDVYGYTLIAPAWRDHTAAWARDKLSALLPRNHRVVEYVTADQTLVPTPQFTNRAGETNTVNVWKMFYSQHQADLLRSSSGIEYDLVIKHRPDVSVTDLDPEACYAQLLANPHQVIFSKNNHHGYWGTRLNDWCAVALPHQMSIYCSVVNHIEAYCKAGMIFHPESLLSCHLHQNQTAVTYGQYQVALRHLGHSVKDIYTSNFGRWA
jgi:hypothetical protein